jgi:hypothetical protein
MQSSLRIVILSAALAAVPVAAVAQTQNQNPPNQNQAQQNTNQNQTQQNQAQPNPAQPQPKQSFWQKMKQSAMQNVQNTTQQGTQQVQNGVQGATNGVQNGVQQGTQGLQGAQQAVAGSASGSVMSSGSGGGSSCGASCFNAGPFVANVSQMTLSQEGAWHIIRMNVQFRNTTNQPLIIAYHDGSMVMTDNNGNTYQGCGGNPGELQGMGIDRGSQTDPQFSLSPGQSGNAMFCVARLRPANSPVGTAYSYNLSIDQLQTQNGATAITLRSYNMNYASLTPGSNSSLTSFASSGTGAAGSTAPATTQTAPTPGSSTSGVTNASLKSTVAPAATTAKPSAGVKPIPTATAATAKKATTTTTPPTNATVTTH